MTEHENPQRQALTALAAIKQAAVAADIDFSLVWVAKKKVWRLYLGSLRWESPNENAAIMGALNTIINSYKDPDEVQS